MLKHILIVAAVFALATPAMVLNAFGSDRPLANTAEGAGKTVAATSTAAGHGFKSVMEAPKKIVETVIRHGADASHAGAKGLTGVVGKGLADTTEGAGRTVAPLTPNGAK